MSHRGSTLILLITVLLQATTNAGENEPTNPTNAGEKAGLLAQVNWLTGGLPEIDNKKAKGNQAIQLHIDQMKTVGENLAGKKPILIAFVTPQEQAPNYRGNVIPTKYGIASNNILNKLFGSQDNDYTMMAKCQLLSCIKVDLSGVKPEDSKTLSQEDCPIVVLLDEKGKIDACVKGCKTDTFKKINKAADSLLKKRGLGNPAKFGEEANVLLNKVRRGHITILDREKALAETQKMLDQLMAHPTLSDKEKEKKSEFPKKRIAEIQEIMKQAETDIKQFSEQYSQLLAGALQELK
jgi:hypothetical protein